MNALRSYSVGWPLHQVISSFPVFATQSGFLHDKAFLSYAHNM